MRVAIVGGIGSGKSEVLRVAGELGLKTLSADEINARLLSDPAYVARIAERFPFAVSEGKVDKKKLASVVFSDEKELAALNAIAHPAILKRITEEKANVLIVEMPLLLESGAEGLFDEIIFVRSPKLIRLMRLKRYRGMRFSNALSRMKRQASAKRLAAVATRIVKNSGSIMKLRSLAKEAFEDIIRAAYAA